MNDKVANDPRIDPRIKHMLLQNPIFDFPNVGSREELDSFAQEFSSQSFYPDPDLALFEAVAPSAGLDIRTRQIVSQPDNNKIDLHIISPAAARPQACIYYIHGGGMLFGSCLDPNFAAWGRLVAAAGVTVVMVEFRNSLVSTPGREAGEFPAGLNDCISGLRWVHAHAAELGVDADRIVVAGESGGANLSIALALSLKRDRELSLVAGLYLMCPFLAPEANTDPNSSEMENEGILTSGPRPNAFAMAYGIEQVARKNPLAWPAYAGVEDVAGLPETVVIVNECDTLRDEGVNFYRLLLAAGVPARCRQLMGTIHGTEVGVVTCPEISREAAWALAHFALSTRRL